MFQHISVVPKKMDGEIRLVRHMELNEYLETVAPLVKEFRACLKNGYFIQIDTYGFGFCTYNDHILYNKKKWTHIGEELALKELALKKVKNATVPDSEKKRFEWLVSMLATTFDVSLGEGLRTPFQIDSAATEKGHKAVVRQALDSHYVNDVLSGVLSLEDVSRVCESVGVRVTKRVLDLKKVVFDINEYRKTLSPVNQVFLSNFEEALKPYKDELRARRKSQIDSLLEKYPVVEGVCPPASYSMAVEVPEREVLFKVALLGYGSAVDQLCSRYVDSMCMLFTSRVILKMNNVAETQKGCSCKVEVFGVDFSSGIIEASVSFTYCDGLEVLCRSKLVVAGGAIQCEHYRYITNYWLNGKKASQQEIDAYNKN